MKKFTNIFLGIFCAMLIINSIHSVSADHSLGGQGIFQDENTVNLVSSNESKYIIHLQIVVRNDGGELVSVTEVSHGKYIPHKITDQIFDNSLATNKITKIDNVRYEKGIDKSTWMIGGSTESVQQFHFPTSIHDVQSFWGLQYCIKTNEHGNAEGISCIPVFTATTPNVVLEDNDVITLDWTILREL